MTIAEQTEYKKRHYAEALRYMANATDSLKTAGKEANRYKDAKYVKTACGTAYNAVLLALDAWFKLKDIEPVKKGSRKDRQYYEKNLTKTRQKTLK